MIKLDQFVEQQRAALERNDTTAALELLEGLADQLSKANSWQDLRSNPPSSYEELITKLENVREVRAPSDRTEIGQLIRVFGWCQRHDIPLSELSISSNLHKYVEAARFLKDIISRSANAAEIRRELLSTIERIKSDLQRIDTRAWAHGS